MEEKPRPAKRLNKTVLKGETREFVVRLYSYFEQENQNGGPLRPVNQVLDRVADALGIDKSTVYRIKQEIGDRNSEDGSESRDGGEEEKQLVTPGRNRKRSKVGEKKSRYITDMDEFTSAAIKNHVDQYIQRGERPTLEKLVDSLGEEDLYDGSVVSLRKVLAKIGYVYEKNGVGCPTLTYKPN